MRSKKEREESKSKEYEIGYFKKIKTLLFHPSEFFESVADEKEYWPIVKFFAKTYIIIIIVNIILSLLVGLKTGFTTFQSLLLISTFEIIFAFIYPFIIAFFTHIGVWIFGGRQGFFNTFKPATYASVIGITYYFIIIVINSIIDLFLSSTSQGGAIAYIIFISIIVLISIIHSVFAEVIGISKFQKISRLRAFFGAVLIPLVLTIIGLIFTIAGVIFLGQIVA